MFYEIFNDGFIYYVKRIIVIQLIVILLFIAATIFSKIVFNYKKRIQKKKLQKMKNTIMHVLTQKQKLQSKTINYAKHNIRLLLELLKHVQEFKQGDKEAKEQVISQIMLPEARKLAHSKNWFKRYLATQCYQYGIQDKDDKTISQLIHDEVLLVALEAAEAAVTFPTQERIDVVIDAFTKGRRIQQASISLIISRSAGMIAPFIMNRIEIEKEYYAKTFCYKLLVQLPPQNKIVSQALNDLHVENIDLKIAVLCYLSHNNAVGIEEILRKNLYSKDWQLRAESAKLLGLLAITSSAEYLYDKLRDTNWWVRNNAAHSLSKMGPIGIKFLQSVTPESDRFAYEVANMTLKIMAHGDSSKLEKL